MTRTKKEEERNFISTGSSKAREALLYELTGHCGTETPEREVRS